MNIPSSVGCPEPVTQPGEKSALQLQQYSSGLSLTGVDVPASLAMVPLFLGYLG